MDSQKFRTGDRIMSIPKNEMATIVSGPDKTRHGDTYYISPDSDPDTHKQVYDDSWETVDSPLIFAKGEKAFYVNPLTKEETQGIIEGPAFDVVGGIRGDVIPRGSMKAPEPLYYIDISVPVDYITKTSGLKIVNAVHLKRIITENHMMDKDSPMKTTKSLEAYDQYGTLDEMDLLTKRDLSHLNSYEFGSELGSEKLSEGKLPITNNSLIGGKQTIRRIPVPTHAIDKMLGLE